MWYTTVRGERDPGRCLAVSDRRKRMLSGEYREERSPEQPQLFFSPRRHRAQAPRPRKDRSCLPREGHPSEPLVVIPHSGQATKAIATSSVHFPLPPSMRAPDSSIVMMHVPPPRRGCWSPTDGCRQPLWGAPVALRRRGEGLGCPLSIARDQPGREQINSF